MPGGHYEPKSYTPPPSRLSVPDRSGGTPCESGQTANAQGKCVIGSSADPAETDEQKYQRYLDKAREQRKGGIFTPVDAAARGFSNEATLGGANKASAGANALFGQGEGNSISERYHNNSLWEKAVDQADSEEHGTAQKLGKAGADLMPYERTLRFLPRGERILRWLKKGKGKNCVDCKGNPIALKDGHKVTSDVDFALPGPLPLALTRSYAPDIAVDGPLGRCRIGAFDEVIEPQEDGELLFWMESGLTAFFSRPLGPGHESRNRLHPQLALTLGDQRRYEIGEGGVVKAFAPFPDGLWRAVEIRDRNGHRATLDRDADGVLAGVRRSDGFRLAFENDGRGLRRAASLVSPSGESRWLSRYGYDERRNLVEVRNHFAASFRYDYDGEGRFAVYTDGVTLRAAYAYDAEGRVRAVTTSAGTFDHELAYGDDGLTTTLSYPAGGGSSTRYTFDGTGKTLTETDGLGNTRRFDRDDIGTLLAETDGEGHRTSYAFDAFGYPSSVVDPEGRRTAYHHDEDGRLLALVDPLGNAWRWRYDDRGNLISSEDPLGHRTDYAVDAAGQPTGIMRHDGLIESRSYDDRHLLARVVDFGGGTTAFARDGFGRVVAVTDPLGQVTRLVYAERDGADFWTPSGLTRPDGVTVSREVEADGARVTTVDGEGRRTVRRYGAYGLLEEIETPGGGRLRFGHDHEGRLVRVENQLGRQWTFARDAAGRVVRETDFDGLTIAYAHDRAGRVVERRHADGARLCFAYDGSGLLLREEAWEPGAAAPAVTRYRYDGRGLLVGARNDDADVGFRLDALGRAVGEGRDGRWVESAFDCCGNRVGRRIGARSEASRFDPMGGLLELSLEGGPSVGFVRDALGREVGRRGASGFRLEQGWDAAGQLVRQAAGGGAGWLGPALERRFRWGRGSAPSGFTDGLWGDTSYAEDVEGQVVEARHGDGALERFGYDGALNVSGSGDAASGLRPWLVSAGGRVRAARGPMGERVVLTHDARGRVVERRVERDGFRARAWRYAWDARDRLVGCEGPGGDLWRYGYDPFGRRVSKARALSAGEMAWVRGRHPGLVPAAFERSALDVWPERPAGAEGMGERPPVVGEAYLWDGDVVAEAAPLRLGGGVDWARATRWHYGPGGFVPLAKEAAGGRVLHVVADHLGTPRELFDDAGRLVWAGEQHLWGGLRRVWAADEGGGGRDAGGGGRSWGALALQEDPAGVAASQACPVRFQGQWADAETGLCYNRFRHYDPLAAAYVSPDPIGIEGGLRTLAYVGNSLVFTDPLGLAKTYQTYIKPSLKGGNPYSGRTSGCCSPAQNVANRDRGHHKNGDYGPAQLDQSSSNPDAIRGREQQLIDANGGAQSTGGNSGNVINGISPNNPKGPGYIGTANKEFGPP